MAWIKAGTVAISNGGTTVTGTGTSWLTGVSVGDAFVAPDGRLYEITAINDATSLVIAPAYQGSGVSGSDYIIAPTRALTGALAERVQSLISDFSDVKDNVGASKMGDFITYLLDQDTGLQRVGSNTQALVCGGTEALRLTSDGASGGAVQSSSTDDTTGKLMTVGAFGWGANGNGVIDGEDLDDFDGFSQLLSILSKSSTVTNSPKNGERHAIISVKAGGSQSAQIAAQCLGTDAALRWRGKDTTWSDWRTVYDRLNAVGTASQSGGVPTGAIIETGDNANGRYTRFADGTQICTSPTYTDDATSAYGALYRAATATVWTYPASFSAIQSAGATCLNDSNCLVTASAGGATCGLRIMHPYSTAGRQFSGFAIGRWF